MLARLCSKSFKLGFSSMKKELPDVQAGFRRGRGTRDQIANIHWIIRKQGNARKTSTSVSLTMLNPLTVDHNKLENSYRDRNTRPPYLSPVQCHEPPSIVHQFSHSVVSDSQ